MSAVTEHHRWQEAKLVLAARMLAEVSLSLSLPRPIRELLRNQVSLVHLHLAKQITETKLCEITSLGLIKYTAMYLE